MCLETLQIQSHKMYAIISVKISLVFFSVTREIKGFLLVNSNINLSVNYQTITFTDSMELCKWYIIFDLRNFSI